MIAGIILAAGSSARLGRSKQLLDLGGEPLIRRTAERVLASALDEVILVAGFDAEAVTAAVADLPLRVVVNPDAARGQSTSLLAGLAALAPGTEAVVFLLGDQPGVDPLVIDALVAAWRASNAPVVAPQYRDGMGNPVLFDGRVIPELRRLTGDAGARPIVQGHQAAGNLVLVPMDQNAPGDVDSEQDYQALQAAWTMIDCNSGTKNPLHAWGEGRVRGKRQGQSGGMGQTASPSR